MPPEEIATERGYRRLPAGPGVRWAVGQVVMPVIVPAWGASGTELAAAQSSEHDEHFGRQN